ncbi:hypothetical protein Patl1_11730 [Pistacia atlantica]|uniref:Uncharacterized protein n=1 Tax=Pistacia atlantica TaxID=434234 RepID=A0ACC1A7A0_9ROSI|nr:hypothetical protein Patl1_11730 [Pistacia atlantica]
MGRLRRVGRGVVARTMCYDWKVGGMGGSTTAEGGGNGWECGCWSEGIEFNISKMGCTRTTGIMEHNWRAMYWNCRQWN